MRELEQHGVDAHTVWNHTGTIAALGADLYTNMAWRGRSPYVTGGRRPPYPFVYMQVGDVCSAGVVIDGEPMAGARAAAGGIAHLRVRRTEDESPCPQGGQPGCLQTVASADAIMRALRESRILPEGASITDALQLKSPAATRVFGDAGYAIGSATAQINGLLDPGEVVVGGIVTRSRAFFSGLAAAHKREGGPSDARVRLIEDDLPLAPELLGALRWAVQQCAPPLIQHRLAAYENRTDGAA
jgi:predicted NBD/HSP70 family sugar kinase